MRLLPLHCKTDIVNRQLSNVRFVYETDRLKPMKKTNRSIIYTVWGLADPFTYHIKTALYPCGYITHKTMWRNDWNNDLRLQMLLVENKNVWASIISLSQTVAICPVNYLMLYFGMQMINTVTTDTYSDKTDVRNLLFYNLSSFLIRNGIFTVQISELYF